MNEPTNQRRTGPVERTSTFDVERPVGRDETVCEAIVSTVMTVEHATMTELAPLYAAIDCEALERLVAPGTAARIAFTYEGHRVTVRSDPQVVVSTTLVEASAATTVDGKV